MSSKEDILSKYRKNIQHYGPGDFLSHRTAFMPHHGQRTASTDRDLCDPQAWQSSHVL